MTMFCPNCGSLVEDGTGFCPQCGTVIAETPDAPAKTKRKMKKGVLIGVIAAGILIAAAAVILILTLTGPRHKLIGTWVCKGDHSRYQIEFKQNGDVEEIDTIYYDDGDTREYKYNYKFEVDKDKNLIRRLHWCVKYTYKFNEKKAKQTDRDEDEKGSYWYIDGDTLWINGTKFRRK